MTLGELRAELLKLGIRQVGAMSRPVPPGEPPKAFTFFFSADEKVVVPFALKTRYFLTLRSREDSAKVHPEKYKALMRAIEHDRANGLLPS
ncbi:MAG TPA: hypothetical protein VGF96_18465 [Terracidiphilus sp.]|jgi:hypothetical protein